MAAPIATTAKKPKKPWYRDLFAQVLIALFAGIAIGHYAPVTGEALKPLGDAFINLIKMMIGPIIFCTIVTGVAGIGNMRQAGRVGIKALIYFEIVTTIALLIGIFAVHTFQPGAGMAIGHSVDSESLAMVKEKTAEHMMTTTEFMLNIIPKTFVSGLTEGQILQVLCIALFFAAGLAMMGEKGKPVADGIEALSHVVFNIITMIVKLAPFGVLGATAFAVSKFGVGSLADLGGLMLVFFGSCIAFVIVILGAVMKFYCRLSLFQFLRYIREEIAISFGTASSETVLPRMIDKMTALGCARPVVGMVLPTGYSFNLDGTTLYLSMAAMFVAYATGVELTHWQEATLIGILLVTSKGAAAVYGAAFVVLAATLNALQVFPEDQMAVALALLFSIDRIMAPGRVLTNLIGNGVATLAISKWENALNYEQARAILAQTRKPELETAVK